MQRPASTSTSTHPAVSPRPPVLHQVNTQTKILDSVHGRILCIADIRGRLSALNDLAREANADAIIHTGDFGFFGEYQRLREGVVSDKVAQNRRAWAGSTTRRSVISPCTLLLFPARSGLIYSRLIIHHPLSVPQSTSIFCQSSRLCFPVRSNFKYLSTLHGVHARMSLSLKNSVRVSIASIICTYSTRLRRDCSMSVALSYVCLVWVGRTFRIKCSTMAKGTRQLLVVRELCGPQRCK